MVAANPTSATVSEDDTVAARLAAGQILPGADEVGDDRGILTARRYRHPALEDRVVVRLVPQLLGQAEDLTGEFLGFDATPQTAEVGTAKRSALGFPAWALVNDPANGHHALNLVKDIERLARTARSRAGAAKEGFDSLGTMLGRAAPHFLPTFYEQAGRIFLEHGNDTYAATMFGKARDAEEVHGLEVDPDRVRQVFLEFAFAGALTAKALSAYSRRLARQDDPDAGYELFFRLSVDRIRGGLPPYAGMPQDLRRLAKAAQREAAVEDERLLGAVLDSTAITRASLAFWKSYRKPLIGLAQRDPAIPRRLLTFVPSQDSSEASLAFWMDLLRDTGALRLLTEPADATAPSPTPAVWLAAVVDARDYSASRSAVLLDAVGTMIARLIADGEPVRGLAQWPARELDLLDLLLANGVPIADGQEELSLPVQQWLADGEPGRRDLVALSASPQFQEALARGVGAHLEPKKPNAPASIETLTELRAVPGLRTALAHWITTRTAEVGESSLPILEKHLKDTFAALRRPEAFIDVPEAAETLATVDVTEALRQALRSGLIDELGWPALEAAVGRLSGPGWSEDDEIQNCGEGWPALVLRRGETFLVVGPDGVLAEHLSRIPTAARNQWYFEPRAHWFDGVLLVVWRGPDGNQAYWSDAPTEVFSLTDESHFDAYWELPHASIALPDGARFTGGRAVRPGDTAIPAPMRVMGDGITVWQAPSHYQERAFPEVDPATGEIGRISQARFFENSAGDGRVRFPQYSDLRPAVPATAASPLGAADGLHGWRVSSDGDWTLGEGIDGRRVRLPSQRGDVPEALLRLPGGAELVVTDVRFGSHLQLLDMAGRQHSTIVVGVIGDNGAPGTAFLPPKDWFHLLRPRDEAGSLALRQLTRSAAGEMIDTVVAALERRDQLRQDRLAGNGQPDSEEQNGVADAAQEAVTSAVPALTDPALRMAVVDLVRRAARLAQAFRSFGGIADEARTRADVEPIPPSGPQVGQLDLETALHWMADTGHLQNFLDNTPTRLPALLAELGGLATRSTDGPATVSDGGQGVGWLNWLPDLPLVAHRAVSGFTPDRDRDALLLLLRSLADSGIADNDGSWRRAALYCPDPEGVIHRVIPVRNGFLVPVRTQWIHMGNNAGLGVDALAFTRTPGVFDLPVGWQAASIVELTGSFRTSDLRRLLELFEERGPAPWFPQAVVELSERTGLSRSEATLLLAGLPGVDLWERRFLDPEVQQRLGLSSDQAQFAKSCWSRVDSGIRRKLLTAVLPADPARLWTAGPAVEAVADLWVAASGRRRPVPDELLIEASKRLPSVQNADIYVGAIADPESTFWLVPDGAASEELATAIHATPPVLRWLAYVLPVGDPLRPLLTVALAAVRARAANPDFKFTWWDWQAYDNLSALLGEAIDADVERARASRTAFRPREWLAVASDADDAVELTVYPNLVPPQDRELYTALVHRPSGPGIADGLPLDSERLTAACAATAPQDTDPAAYFQDPQVSVPSLVAEISDRFDLTEDASALYLQLLALPDPTDANVARWNAWKPARLRKAKAALAETDLVVTAKRARAGRSLFLPGGWLDLTSPHLPLELWKPPMFGFDTRPTGAVVPEGTVAELFAQAWQRILDGDTPTYHELETGGRR
ncbi:hypothetical protein [Actinoalloteichus hymeniacidonis]|uniref:DNA-binding protein n=1 Tax=Actinoalloteichus hymeniacidonis TaxID=340345 RepID=A0AAC9HSD4_9PSEU|nr:hypothetical protein [Actinoalloteichus hymeniacidonis]AOS64593.1 hypothetical protein TL08_19010 [Actinoalloteichus hymeniacidonis]MBB5907335.1 hypothetical protein [Actinoalloteichus hymeniacidonis]